MQTAQIDPVHAKMIANPEFIGPIVSVDVGQYLLGPAGNRDRREALAASIEILEALSYTPAHPIAVRCIVDLFFRAGYSFRQVGAKIVVRKLPRRR